MNKNDDKFNAKNVIIISLAHLTHDTYSAFLAPILPILIDQLGITLFMAGMLDVVRRVPQLLNPLLGMIADRIRISVFIILAPLVTTLSMSFLGLSPNVIVLTALVFVSGISAAFFHVPSPVLIKHFSGNKIGQGMSFYMLGGELARTLGPLLILSGVSLWGLQGTWRLAPLGIAASLVLFFQFRKVRVHKPERREESKGYGKTFINLLPLFLTIGGIIFFRGAMKAALTIYLPTYLTGKDQSIWMAGISLSVLQFSGAAGTFAAGPLSDRIGRKKVLLIASIINPFLMLLFVNISGVLVIPVLILSGFFLFMTGPVILATVHDVKSDQGAFINGVYMTVNFFFASVMTVLVGFLADRFGMDRTYSATVLLSALAIPVVLFMKKSYSATR
ncbi:MFS transporter [Spirochaeta isovalerica]|uniref:FSR family fosmidomycin resistance protein-like MFS transporter n=1 Tax=Spirochaeta isovalerica TaxID=150 RepID=A0A841R400_9SPIO|nr:MFS transporter [Spirochaeta isovalerica]MBB6479814.1 FSR family fosmidomycin resistance protein-like MFS transporter [Spirochaeta isovalerica]